MSNKPEIIDPKTSKTESAGEAPPATIFRNGRLEWNGGEWDGWPVDENKMTASEICDYWG
jgi:hypothetical protein